MTAVAEGYWYGQLIKKATEFQDMFLAPASGLDVAQKSLSWQGLTLNCFADTYL